MTSHRPGRHAARPFACAWTLSIRSALLLGLIIASLTQPAAAQTASSRPAATQAADRDEDALIQSLFRVQFDHHLHEKLFLEHDPSARLTAERCAEALQRLRPAAVTVCALGHEGWARIHDSAFPPHPALGRDSLRIWREACDQTGTPLFVYVSSLINYKANHEHPEYARYFSNGNPADQRIDHNSAYVEERLIPFCRDLVSRYRPDGLWFDGDYWSIFPSWNPASIRAFEEERKRAAPRDFADPAFPEFWDFTVTSHARYVKKVADAIHAIRPECGLVINSAYTLRQPGALPGFVSRVNLDVPTYFGMEAASIEARYQGARDGRPFDIVIAGHSEPEGAPFGYHKPEMQLEQEFAGILSHGGGVSVYVGVDVDGGFDIEEVAKLRQILERFIRPRAAALQPSVSAADVALLHASADFQYTHRLERLRGAALALLRSNVAFDIIDESQLPAGPGRYRVLVAPITPHTPPAVLRAIQQFVRAGGCAMLSVVPAEPLLARFGELPELLPFETPRIVSGTTQVETEAGRIGMHGAFRLKPRNTNAAAHGTLPDADDAPFEFDYKLAAGHVTLFAADVFAEFDRAADSRLRARIRAAIDRMPGAERSIRVDAPPWVEVILRHTATGQIVHLVNHARGREGRPRAPAVEFVPPIEEVRLSIRSPRMPQSLHCVPEGVACDWHWADGRVHAVLRNVGTHCALILTPPPDTPQRPLQ